MRRLLTLGVAFSAGLWIVPLPSGQAETTRFWRQEKYEEFTRGRAQGMALRSDGELLLAPRFVERSIPSVEFFWAVARDAAGSLYLGGGSPARVIRLDAQGKASTFFESKEFEVHALAFDPAGNLLVATSPDGKVYRVSPAGQAKEFFNPERKYIWDITLDSAGNLYVATGDRGEIFRVAPDGSSKLFFSSAETHVRVLALDPAGNLLVGTEPNGRVIRITPEGAGFVVYETARREVTALTYDSEQNLYVAAIGQKAAVPGFPGVTPPPSVPAATATTVVTAQGVTTQMTPMPGAPAPTPRLPLPTAGGSSIYRIGPDGYAEERWDSENELVYALAFTQGSRLVAGTGNEGRLLAIDSPLLFTNLAKSSASQITALLSSSDGTLHVVAANPGKAYALGPEMETEGSFESDVHDAKLFSAWGRIRWKSRANPGPPSGIRLYTRSGNTSDPEKNWSSWSEAYAEPEGEAISSPPARFLQWKAVLTGGREVARTPSLASVAVAYLRRNVAPMVEKVIVQAPGVRVRGTQMGLPQSEPAQLELPPTGSKQGSGGPRGVVPQPPPQRIELPPQGITEKGARGVVWSASDENEDELEFSIYYRGEGETRWKVLRDRLREKFYTWDAEALPDGAYYLKVVASDAPANPADLAQNGENTSDRFEVDNTPPRVEELMAHTRSRTAEIRFTGRDSFSPIRKAEYSFDATPWQQVFPTTGATDAPMERFQIKLAELEPGEHTVVVRLYDQFGNVGLAKVTFTVK